MFDTCQCLFNDECALFGCEQFGRRTIVKEWQRSFEPVRRLSLVAKNGYGVSDYGKEPVNNLMYCHNAIIAF